MPDMIFSGFGGQGMLTAGLIIARAGVAAGKRVTWIPSYGSEMRGGTANCGVKISDAKIASPFVKNIDILVAMNTPSLDKFMPKMARGALLVVNLSLVKNRCCREDITVVSIDATNAAENMRNPRGANICALGALAASGALFGPDVISSEITKFFEAKKKDNPKNLECFVYGLGSAAIRRALS
jgi:2-oxoglutarate ferredoxin oxidoreductase subunit gamma